MNLNVCQLHYLAQYLFLEDENKMNYKFQNKMKYKVDSFVSFSAMRNLSWVGVLSFAEVMITWAFCILMFFKKCKVPFFI